MEAGWYGGSVCVCGGRENATTIGTLLTDTCSRKQRGCPDDIRESAGTARPLTEQTKSVSNSR